jgi:hypothetical protein
VGGKKVGVNERVREELKPCGVVDGVCGLEKESDVCDLLLNHSQVFEKFFVHIWIGWSPCYRIQIVNLL